MARVTDPNFGAGFDADLFRSAITSAMEMGLPQETSERATFRWHTSYTYDVADPEGNPYDFNGEPATTVSKPDVQVPVAVQFFGSDGNGTAMGEFDNNRTILTILDIHYEQVKDADQVLLGGNTYVIDYVAPPTGLFEVTVYNLYIMSVDES
jgi:hypothetical protein